MFHHVQASKGRLANGRLAMGNGQGVRAFRCRVQLPHCPSLMAHPPFADGERRIVLQLFEVGQYVSVVAAH
jgi:hypothetical protein